MQQFSKHIRAISQGNVIDTLFHASMYWRIVYGCIRIVLGFLFFNLIGTSSDQIAQQLMHHELVEDPNDILITITTPFIGHFPFTITFFLAVYFIFWGVIDTVLSIAMLREHRWAFPFGIGLIILFIIYEIFRATHTHSPILLTVILIDIGVVWVIFREYQKRFVAHDTTQ